MTPSRLVLVQVTLTFRGLDLARADRLFPRPRVASMPIKHGAYTCKQDISYSLDISQIIVYSHEQCEMKS